MDTGFQKASSDNLPRISDDMIFKYFVNNPNFTSTEMRGVKTERSARNDYGDNAIGYVQLKREGYVCTVKARVTPEHRIRKKAYSVTLKCDEDNEVVITSQCDGCAASQGGCKHAVAFLFWVHRKSMTPSPTEVQCYWKKSNLSNIGSTQKFVYAEELGGKTTRKLHPKDPSLAQEFCDLAKLRNVCDVQLRNYISRVDDLSARLSIHNLMAEFVSSNGGTSCDEFLSFLSNKITDDLCKEAALKTLGQSQNPIWHELRYARITASKAHSVMHCSTSDGSLVESVLGMRFRPTAAMKRGSKLESEVLDVVKTKYKSNIKPCGLLLNPHFPIFGASPDGIAKDFIVEIKCPSKETTMDNYIGDGAPAEKHLVQMQLQMLFSKKTKALFCIAHPDFENTKKITEFWVSFDENFTASITSQCLLFWKDAIFSRIYMKQS